MANKKQTGLGTSAFFNKKDEDDSTPAKPKQAKPAKPEKPKKVRTTVTLYPETLASLELLKVEARKSGVKATMSDVLSEAIAALMDKKGLSL